MLVVIGDIHGCLDPLKALIKKREMTRKRWGYNMEYLFLGDYIDRGPCVKDVLDYLIALDAKKTFLVGNHEDMLMMYHRGHELFERIGNAWFAKNNGGLSTVEDLDGDSPIFEDVWDDFNAGNNSYKYKANHGEFRFDPKYESFFDQMKYAEKRNFNIKGQAFSVLFSHSVPNPKIPLEELLNCSSYEEFHGLNKKYKVYEDESSLWNREFLSEPIDGCTLVHGHTPTFKAKEYIKRRPRDYSEPATEFVNSNFDEKNPHQVFYTTHKETGKVLQVDLDTGAVYGGRLSSITFPETDEEAEILSRMNTTLAPVYVDLSKGFYDRWLRIQEEFVSIEQFVHEE